ncbi:(2Fe-2S)-binding protein [Pseudoflavonifractor sp. 524-17]|uniref:(2Fe-2S)-binding protein n=1 Tax=Pseudoflavonifractor sp. 524-17 TaxID=2304577 RepID=UPI00137B23A2|nr:(2Fe-2S)-binding protein [Pseudoflavonifractor sp. 524-17]NCE63664.1 (2Fe-2S)-binding protein [Pseudoflavonifractor sp. 524-17]
MYLSGREHPIVDYPERKQVRFTFDGTQLMGLEGQPIAAALVDNGIRAFRHTHKTGQPRGLFCGIGQCSDCVVVVNGTPNVRSCVTPLEEGMVIETQHGLGKVGVRCE